MSVLVNVKHNDVLMHSYLIVISLRGHILNEILYRFIMTKQINYAKYIVSTHIF